MAYKVKRRVFRDFRHEFPQLCAATPAPEPMDFSFLKNIEEVVKPVEELPPGWINIRTYAHVKPEEPELDAHTLMHRGAQKLRTKWEKWNREHDIHIDYDYYDDRLTYEDESEEESEDSYAEDPDDKWSD